jgi:DnaJ-class molecular chaperone
LPSGKPCSTCRGTGIFDKIEETCKICNGTGIYPKPVQKRVGFKAQACGVCEAVGRVIFLNPVLKEEHVAVLLAR